MFLQERSLAEYVQASSPSSPPEISVKSTLFAMAAWGVEWAVSRDSAIVRGSVSEC